MIIRNLDDGSTSWVPDRSGYQPAPAPPDEPLPAYLSEPWPVAPTRTFPPVPGPYYVRTPRPSVQSFVLAWAIILGGLVLFLSLLALVFG